MIRIFSILLVATIPLFGQYSADVRFITQPERNSVVGTIERGSILYGSVNDLAAVFLLDIYVNNEVHRIDLHGERRIIRITADNSFVLVTDPSGAASVVQLPAGALAAAGAFFVPLEAFIPLLNMLTDEPITFSSEQRLIEVGTVRTRATFTVPGLLLEEKANGMLVRIRLNRPVKDYESWLKPIALSDPKAKPAHWLYLTIADATADTAVINAIQPKGMIRKLVALQSPSSVQLTIRLEGEVTGTELLKTETEDELLLTIHAPTAEQRAARRQRELQRGMERERAKWKLDVIVIDAGHGGKDPGTIGVARTKEKDITLAIALKLGKLIQQQLTGVKVVYTRERDEFVELFRRGQIANQAGGKLFISIHCNSAHRKPHAANGFEIYLLRPGKTEHAVRIAERENEVVKLEEGYEKRYQQLTEENFILLTMAQSAYVKYSEQFADVLQRVMSDRLDIANNGVKQAGFYVLVGASMPNVLIETGYLSHREEERVLRSTRGQQRVAEAIFHSIKEYKKEYERGLEEGRLMGADGE